MPPVDLMARTRNLDDEMALMLSGDNHFTLAL
jgi:hypothetical protein